MLELNVKVTGFDEGDLVAAFEEIRKSILAGTRKNEDSSDLTSYSYDIKGRASVEPGYFQERSSEEDFIEALERFDLKGNPSLVFNKETELFSYKDTYGSVDYIKVENTDYDKSVIEGDTVDSIMASVLSNSDLETFVRKNQKYADDFAAHLGWV